MMRSLNSGVAGLRSHQTKMDVIGTNIANVNTYGFKSSRTTFSDVFYQTLSSGSAPTNVTGGTNPTQIGYGSMVATIDVMNSQSGPASTDRALDVYINGDGMLAVKDANGNLFYTRLGNLGFDAEGNLVDPNGNYVMGFPLKDDGTPAINPDGTIDVEDLSKITVDKEMLDQMTNITIGPTGEIMGIMPGDAEITLSSKRPPWLVDVQIAEDSDVVGDVKVTMEYRSTFDDSNLPAWIKSITPKANSMLDGNYVFEYDGTTIKATNGDTNDVLTGTYRKNGTITLSNAKGEAVLTIQTDSLNEPDAGAGEVTFDVKQMLRVDWTDKGGTADFAEVEFTGSKGNYVLGDITLTIDGDLADETTSATLVYDSSNSFHKVTTGGATTGFIEGVYLDSATLFNADELQLGVGVKMTVTSGISGNNYLKFMVNDSNKPVYEEMCKALAAELPPGSSMYIDTVSTATDFTYQIKDTNGNVLATSTAVSAAGTTPITFSATSGTITDTWNFDGPVGSEQFTVKTEATGLSSTVLKNYLNSSHAAVGNFNLVVSAGPPYTVTLNGPGGLIATTSVNDVNENIVLGTGASAVTLGKLSQDMIDNSPTLVASMTGPTLSDKQKFGTVSEQNTLRLYDQNGKMLAEAAYSGQSTVSLGDLSLVVDKTGLQTEFAKRNDVEDDTLWQSLGTMNRDTGPDWEYSNNAANAAVGIGESVLVGVIALAKIPNMVAMEQSGNSYFVTSGNSGEATFLRPGINNTGELTSGYLEMSNVDVSKEFTDMITTQRGFQANTRIITVSDEMLNELVNLKR